MVALTVVVVAASMLFLWRIGTPSPWRDEVVSVVVARRGPLEIMDVVRHVDLVHALYYLTSWAVTGGAPTVLALRVVSAAAFIAATVVTYRLGVRLDGHVTGFVAAALVVASPLASRYAQEARPYALVTLAATVSTLLLVRLVDRSSALWRILLPYSVSVIVLVLLNTLAVLLLISHLSYLLLRGGQARLRGVTALATSALVLLPFVAAAATQRGQVGWLPRPDVATLIDTGTAVWGSGAMLSVALVVPVIAVRVATGAEQRATLAMLLSWGYVPPLLLWSLSQVHPLFDRRYVVYCLPGGMLAFAVGLAIVVRFVVGAARQRSPRVSRTAGTALFTAVGVSVVTVVAVTGLTVQNAIRGPIGHTENLRGAARTIAAAAQPRVPILFDPGSFRLVKPAYPALTENADDVALCRPGEAGATLLGDECDRDQVERRLARATRVLLLTRGGVADAPEQPPSAQDALLRSLGFVQTRAWQVEGGGFRLVEWERST